MIIDQEKREVRGFDEKPVAQWPPLMAWVLAGLLWAIIVMIFVVVWRLT
jgi:hypothetical protein